MVDSSGATDPLNIGNLPDDMLRETFKRVVKQADSVAASQRSINALRNVNQKFRAVVDSEFREETRSARFKEAIIDAGNSAGTRTANDIIIYHGVDGLATKYRIKKLAAERDINAGMNPRAAIERHDVDDPVAQNMLKEHAALRDINAGMDPHAVIERHDVDDPVAQNMLKEHAAMRDINMVAGTVVKPHPLVAAGKVATRAIRGFFLATGRRIRNLGSAGRLQAAMRDINADPEIVAGTVIERNGVDDPVAKNKIKEYAAMRDIMAGVVAGTAIERNGVDDPVAKNTLKEHAAVRDIEVGMVAGAAIERNGVNDPHARDRIELRAAVRDIKVGIVAGTAIGRNDVHNPLTQDRIKWYGAESDIKGGVVAGNAIERNGLNDPVAKNTLKELAAVRAINAGVVARIAFERHGVDNQDTRDRIKEQALKRDIGAGMSAAIAQERHNLNPCTLNSSNLYTTRGLDERSRQEEGREL
ncbi:hypothetical protein [Mesorhizobium sp. M1403]|uniref:hypothetical protein n=1 Tax=Mesorhizobium sp. M1403 TaxID=2957097 RepID=UPI0033393CD2